MGCTRRACAAPQSTSTRGCWRILTACGKGAVGGTFRTCCPTAHPHTPGLILSASDGIWNVLFSTCSHTSRWVRFRFGGCVSLVVAHVRPTHIALHEHHVMQFPFLPERRGRGAPMAPVPLKRKRDMSAEPKTDPMKRAYMLVPGEAKLWFVEIHAYQARVHGKSLACNIRWAKDLVPELFGPRTSLMPSRPGSASASPLGSTSTAVCCASSASNSSPADIGHRLSMKRRPIECAFMDQSFRASTTQDAFLDMIDAIDADMNAQLLDRAYMRVFKNSIRSEVAKHFAEFFLEAESNFERVNLDSSTSVLRQLQTARNIEPLAGASSIGRRWSSVSFSPDAEAEARDSEPEAHVMEPLAATHQVLGSCAILEQRIGRHSHSQGVSSASPARACMLASIASLSSVVARSSPVPSLALRTGSNDQCDGNQCCPSFGGCPRGHHPGVEPAA